MIKRIWLVASVAAVLTLVGRDAHAVPDAVAFSARLTNAGVPVNGLQNIEVRLFDANTAGNLLWSESYPSAEVAMGQVYFALGTQTPNLIGHFNGQARFIEVVVNSQVMTPRLPIVSVPYAFRAGDAETLGGLAPGDVVTSVTAGSGLSGGGSGGAVSLAATARGVVFTRWGREDCPSGTSTVYVGYAAGGAHNHGGSGANQLCLTNAPTWDNFTSANENGALVYGTEYQMQGHGLFGVSPFNSLHDHDAPCAVCLDSSADLQLLLPGANVCPSGWNTRVQGYLMGNHYTQAKGEFVCVDRQAVPRGGSSNADSNGALWYPTEAECGSLPCGPYVQDRELTCAVCTR